MPRPDFLPVLVLAVLLTSLPARAAEPAPNPAQVRFFENKVRPLLVKNCQRCHGPTRKRGKLRLDSRAAILQGGDSGPAIVPGKPRESLLVKAINYTDLEMPPGKRLGRREVAILTEWVQIGAPWPGAAAAPAPPRKDGFRLTAAARKWWSFRPVARPAVPARKHPAIRNPIDAFVLARLQARGLSFSPPAPKRELIRRAYFDLLGLPPSPEDVDSFVADRRPDAYERLLDRLLASPQYGERWGRHWLDLVRFAQTNGYERDGEKPHVWRYRDYVIRALNQDKPYNQFVREQLAGDELERATDDSLTATAFYRLGVWDDEPDDVRQSEFDDLDDMLSTTGSVFLGLTLGCARCHDHKFDPLGQEDYYAMLAFLRNVSPYVYPHRDKKGPALTSLSAGGKTLAVRERGPRPLPTHLLARGSAATPGKVVQPRFVRVLCPTDGAATPRLPQPGPKARSTGRRRALAEWIANKDNPLTARVMANRLWHHHFGRGIVPTPSDLGKTGLPPTHPELLDWLASELVAGGWRLKRLHRLIMLSHTYRQSSRTTHPRAVRLDPGNTLLWRQNLRRLEAEAIRDAVLAVSGQLNLRMGGRGIFPALPREVLSTQSRPGAGWGRSTPRERGRRSVYIFSKRTLGVPLLEVFDQASPDKSIAARTTTTIAPQALILLNSAFMDEQANAFAARLLRESGTRPRANVERAFRVALARRPAPQEARIALAYLDRRHRSARADASRPAQAVAYRRALAELCKVVLNLNEMVYVD
jgi:hypothetical protein